MVHNNYGISSTSTCELVWRWYGSQVQCHCTPAAWSSGSHNGPRLCCSYHMRQIDDQGACLRIPILYGYLAVETEGYTYIPLLYMIQMATWRSTSINSSFLLALCVHGGAFHSSTWLANCNVYQQKINLVRASLPVIVNEITLVHTGQLESTILNSYVCYARRTLVGWSGTEVSQGRCSRRDAVSLIQGRD